MPGYNTHRLFNYVAFIIIAAFLYSGTRPFLDLGHFLILCAGFYAGTEFITPDLDIESSAGNRWGALKVIWLPYRVLFKHGKSSHNIVYGAVVRLLYIGLIILGVYYLLFRAFPSDMMILPFDYVLIILTGIILANALHVILDMLF
ncbi:MAG: DUF2227 family putative metal-binding protein [Candidatus Methanoperedens sp.]|nr:DUF2227 family putative metal-binding protein [Candidatus Methanoperedens sp.]